MASTSATSDDQRPRASIHEAACRVARELRQRGHTAYFAGGCVRDRLLGREPKDYDVATDATPDQVRAIFRKTQEVGAAFGVMLVRLLGQTIEVTTFRAEGAYSDARRPDSVVFTDARTDAQRRDFTINGLFQDPETDEIIDYVGGRADLDAGVIRAIGDPAARLREDRLRMLRAVRFAARFHFTIEDSTARAIRHDAGQLEGVSRERIGQEIKWMLTEPTRGRAVELLQSFNLDAIVLEEPSVARPAPHVAALPEAFAYPAVLAAWRIDRADSADRIDPHAAARSWARSLMLSRADETGMAQTLALVQDLADRWPRLGVAGRKRMASRHWFQAALAIMRVDNAKAAEAIAREVDELARTGLAPEPFLNGDDLVTIGLKPGPIFRDLLEKVYDAQLEGRIHTRKEAMDLARRLASEDAAQAE